MASRDLRQHELWEEIKELDFDPVLGLGWLIGRLDRLFWKLEREEFPVEDTHRRFALVYSLPENLRQIAFQLWDDYD